VGRDRRARRGFRDCHFRFIASSLASPLYEGERMKVMGER